MTTSPSAMTSQGAYRYYSLKAVVAQAYATLRHHFVSILSIVGAGHAPNPGDTEVSIPWLTKVLIAAEAIPRTATITSAECRGLDGNRGLAGVMSRIHVSYVAHSGSNTTEGTSKEDTQELRLILKMSGDGYKNRLGGIISGQGREAIFYSSDMAKALLPKTLLPKVYYARGPLWLGETVILMEDIKQRGHGSTQTGTSDTQPPIDVNFVFGNQIWGLPPSVDQTTFPPATDTLDQMFITAAGIHAQHWNDSRLLQMSWLKCTGWYRGVDRDRWEWSVQAAAASWEKEKAKVAGGDYNVKYSEKFIRIMDRAFEQASWEKLQHRLQDRTIPFTLSHGDFHAANMILDRSKSSASPDLAIYDWSEVCVWEPTTDLGQTVISDVAIPVFQAHARVAVHKYWERLIELGAIKPSEYTFETCWKSFLRGGVEKWLWVFAILCGFPKVPPQLVQYFHDQMLAFIELGEVEGDISYDITTVVCFAPPSAQ